MTAQKKNGSSINCAKYVSASKFLELAPFQKPVACSGLDDDAGFMHGHEIASKFYPGQTKFLDGVRGQWGL